MTVYVIDSEECNMISHGDAALTWYDAGMAVIPARTDGSKRPVHEWKKFQGQRPARHLVEGWYKNKPEWGIGIVCGQASGNLEMLEIEAVRMSSDYLDDVIDAMNDLGILDAWEMLTSDTGYSESTPSGGIHILYRIEDCPVPGNTKIAMSQDSQVTYAETRGEGGFVIVAPTGGTVHPSGESWTVLFGEIGIVPTITWEQRNAVHAALKKALDERVIPVYERPVGLTYDRTKGDRPGDAFNDDPTVTIGDVLLRNGWKFLGIKQGQEEYVHPRSSDMTTGSARTGYKGLSGLYAWSGMPHEGSFDKFSILTHLEFGGDFSACSRYLRRQGYGSSTWNGDDRELIDMNDFQPSEKAVVEAIAEAVDTPSTLTEQPSYRLDEYTHVGVAKVLKRAIGARFRSVSEEKLWRVYSDGRWMADRENALPQRMEPVTGKLRDHCDSILARAQEHGDKEEIMAARKIASFGASLRSNRGIKDVMDVFGQQQGISTSAARFDVDTNLLVMANGTFELDTMTLREHRPDDMLTKRLDVVYDPTATAPRWERFLQEAISNESTRLFLQRSVGMTALGTTQEGAMFILHGPSGCGKSTFLEVLAGVFGEYAASTPSSTFAAARTNREKGTSDLHSLMGVRFASLSETDRGARLDESLIKSVTGGDRVTSRALYQDFVTWKPQFTLWMATNHLPSISFDDDAIWRRVKPVEFPNSFTTGARERELNLSNKILASEKAGVLNWILDGVRAYLTEGFEQPESVSEAVRSYQTESDPVNTFLVEATDEGRIEQSVQFEIKSSELYRVYAAWCSDNSLRPLSDRAFGRRLKDLGFAATRGNGGVRMRAGIRLNPAFGVASAQRGAEQRWW